MTPRRPYLLRAFYDWLLDNKLTPYLIINAIYPGIQAPLNLSRDDKIILNISPSAVRNLELGKNEVQFNARFSGVLQNIVLPVAAILAICARENGAGTLFEPEIFSEIEGIVKDFANKPHNITESFISVVDNNCSKRGDKKEVFASSRYPGLHLVK